MGVMINSVSPLTFKGSADEGFSRRLFALRTYRVEDQNKDYSHRLNKKIEPEVDVIVKWAISLDHQEFLKGMANHSVDTDESKAVITEVRIANDSALDFINSALVPSFNLVDGDKFIARRVDKDSCTSAAEMYQVYKLFCKARSYKTKGFASFKETLEKSLSSLYEPKDAKFSKAERDYFDQNKGAEYRLPKARYIGVKLAKGIVKIDDFDIQAREKYNNEYLQMGSLELLESARFSKYTDKNGGVEYSFGFRGYPEDQVISFLEERNEHESSDY